MTPNSPTACARGTGAGLTELSSRDSWTTNANRPLARAC